jgi:hypothetical protein
VHLAGEDLERPTVQEELAAVDSKRRVLLLWRHGKSYFDSARMVTVLEEACADYVLDA